MDSQYTDRLLETVNKTPLNLNDVNRHQVSLHSIYNAVIHGDFDQLGALVTDDIELHISGFGPFNGSWRGRGDVIAATRRNFALLANQQPQIENLISQGNCVVVLIRESGELKEGARKYDLRGVQWFTFVDGKLKRIEQILAEMVASTR